MPWPKFRIRSLLWFAPLVAAFSGIVLLSPLERWPDATKGAFVLVASIAGAVCLLSNSTPLTLTNRVAGLLGLAFMALMGLVGILSAIF